MTLVIGFALSFLVAVVPHFNGAYRLEALLLADWMIPYVILSVIVWFLRGAARLRVILVLVGIHLVTALIQRTLLVDPDGMLIHVVPLVSALVLLLAIPQLQGRATAGLLGPLVARFLKRS